MNATSSPDKIEACWNRIGVSGDGSCPELKQVIHCHNCPVYSSAGRSLFDRNAPEGYLDEWTRVLSGQKREGISETTSVVIFRLGVEWLALPTLVFKEMADLRVVHHLPHRTNDILLGIVNIGGELQLCVSLTGLLGIAADEGADAQAGHGVYKRMAVVERDRERWVFPMDEIHDVHRLPPDALLAVPVTVSKAAGTYTKGIFQWQDRSVGLLDDELIFSTLKRNVL